MKYRLDVVKHTTKDYKDVDSCFDGLIEEIDKAEAQGYKIKDVQLGTYLMKKGEEEVRITVIKKLKGMD